jgi:hypothetical protein
MNRRLRPLALAGLLGLLLAANVGGLARAGGWATITPDEGSATVKPKEDEPVVLGFTVLQHGETPAPWEHPTVVATNATTGERLDIAATSTGPEGHFEATITFPEAGIWSWRVELRDLIVDMPVSSVVPVRTADGRAPALDVATVGRIADQAATRVRDELGSVYGETISTLERESEVAQANIASLQRLVAKQASASAVAGGAGGSTAASASQLLAVVVLGGLAGVGGALVTLVGLGPRFRSRAATPDSPAAPGYASR